MERNEPRKIKKNSSLGEAILNKLNWDFDDSELANEKIGERFAHERKSSDRTLAEKLPANDRQDRISIPTNLTRLSTEIAGRSPLEKDLIISPKLGTEWNGLKPRSSQEVIIASNVEKTRSSIPGIAIIQALLPSRKERAESSSTTTETLTETTKPADSPKNEIESISSTPFDESPKLESTASLWKESPSPSIHSHTSVMHLSDEKQKKMAIMLPLYDSREIYSDDMLLRPGAKYYSTELQLSRNRPRLPLDLQVNSMSRPMSFPEKMNSNLAFPGQSTLGRCVSFREMRQVQQQHLVTLSQRRHRCMSRNGGNVIFDNTTHAPRPISTISSSDVGCCFFGKKKEKNSLML